jgi:hypothetical protein
MNQAASSKPAKASLEALIENYDIGVESFHPGGPDLTLELAERCHVHGGSNVMDVASGAGATACRSRAGFWVWWGPRHLRGGLVLGREIHVPQQRLKTRLRSYKVKVRSYLDPNDDFIMFLESALQPGHHLVLVSQPDVGARNVSR